MENSPICYWDDILFYDVKLQIIQWLNPVDRIMLSRTSRPNFRSFYHKCDLNSTLFKHGTMVQLNEYKDILTPDGILSLELELLLIFGNMSAIEWVDSILSTTRLPYTMMSCAVLSDNPSVVQWCLSRITLKTKDQELFALAMEELSHGSILKYSLDNGLIEGCDLMHSAIDFLQYEKIELLLKYDIEFCEHCIAHGVLTCNLDMLKWLWNRGCRYDQDTFTAAFFAVPNVLIWDFLLETECPLDRRLLISKLHTCPIVLVIDWLSTHGIGINCSEKTSLLAAWNIHPRAYKQELEWLRNQRVDPDDVVDEPLDRLWQ